MKMKRYIFLIIAITFMLFSCEEKGPLIILEPTPQALVDTTFIIGNIPPAQQKVVLLEEFTGVKCTNCPTGHQKVAELYTANPSRFIAIAYHTNFLGAPYTGDIDLRNEKAEQFAAALGPINGKPSAFVDRKNFSTNPTRDIINPDLWPQFVNEQLTLSTPVNLLLEKVNLDENARVLRYRITLTYTQAAQNHNLGFAISENNIQASQLSSGTVISNYNHKHVFRDFLTPFIGVPLTETLESGRVIIKEFEFEIPLSWNIENLELVAFVRQSNDEIVHATYINLN
jgi:hypothetical protein